MRIYTIVSDEVGDWDAPSVGLYPTLEACKAALTDEAQSEEHDGTPESGCRQQFQPILGLKDRPPAEETTCLVCRIEDWDGDEDFWVWPNVGRGDMRVVASWQELTT